MHFLILILGIIGAFFLWMLKGFKGSFDEYFKDNKDKIVITGFFVVVVLLLSLYYFLKYFFQITWADWNKPI